MRIVPLLASATEIVCALGLQDALVGVTRDCDFPPHVADLPGVTRTRQHLHLLESVSGWSGVSAVRDGRVHLTDGSRYFSRPGPRLADSLEMLAQSLHSDLHRLPEAVIAAEAAWS